MTLNKAILALTTLPFFLLGACAQITQDIGDYGARGKNARPLGNELYLTPNELIPLKIK